MMDLIYVIFFVAILSLFAGAIKSGGKRRFKYNPHEEWPFEKQKLMSHPEQVMYFRLREALPDYCIFSQVQLSQLVRVKKGHDFKQWFNRINRMSADFVVTDKSMSTIAVIEVDDKTHQRADRIEQDKKKDKALKSAGIEVIRWPAKPLPTVEAIRSRFWKPTEETFKPAVADQPDLDILKEA
ncbi:DUF2726 domain-containing protein [Cellvibrio sp. ARAG 10.3]|uniref:DUF2726 domain-containing protein n=1 Tax=Cellvibrio sp. ARAG 10.3 TaxID=3451358 RepID=UPI003F48E4E6